MAKNAKKSKAGAEQDAERRKENSSATRRNATAGAGSGPAWLRWSPVIIIVLLIAVYGKVTGFDYIGLDDTTIIKGKIFLLSNFDNLKMAFTTDAFLEPVGSFYRPLQTMSFMVDAHYGQAQPYHYHLTNLIVYILGCMSIYWLLLSLQYRRLTAFLLCLVYSVHPLFVSTVAWIPSRGDTFLTIFTVLTLIFFIRSYRSANPLNLVFHALSLFLAFLSKETAAAIPVLCVAYYYVELRDKAPWSSLMKYVLSWIPVTLIWLYLHSKLNTVASAGNLVGVGPFIANLQTIPETFGKFLLPFNFKLIPLFNSADTIAGLIAIAITVALITWKKKWSDARVLLGLFWFFLFITPVMLYRKEDAQFMFEYLYHRSFIASIGLIIVTAQLLGTALESTMQNISIAIFAVVSIAFSVLSSSELSYYKDGATFFTEAAVRTPQSSMSYNNIGLAKRLEGDYRGAVDNFSKAIAIQSGYAKAYINRGGMYFMLNEIDSAYRDFSRAIELDPSSPDAYSNRCAVEQRMKRYNEALADINQALTLNPYYSDGYQNRGVVKNSLRMYTEAIADFNESLRINPENGSAYFGRGFSHLNMQNTTGACEDWSHAAALGVKDAERFRAQYCK